MHFTDPLTIFIFFFLNEFLCLYDDVNFLSETIILEVIAFQSVQLNDKYYACRIAACLSLHITQLSTARL